MKRLLALLAVTCLSAQDGPLPVPQYDEAFYRYDRILGKLFDLERQVAVAESKSKTLGFDGYQVSLTIRGSHSPVRFRQGEPLEFVVGLRTDPRAVQFLVLRASKNRRDFVQWESTSPLGAAKNVSARSEITYEIQKHGDSAYRVIPSKPLQPGEYALSLETNNVTYAFGIDSASTPGRQGK